MPAGRMGAVGAKPAASSSFTPTDLATLSGWWDASHAASFTYNTGTEVEQWNDRSGLGKHLTKASRSAGYPERNRTVNSLSAVDFSGDAVGRDNCPINNSSDGTWTVFAVAVLDSTSSTRSIVDADPQSGTRISQFVRTSGTTSQTIGFVGGSAKTDNGPTVTTATTYLFRSVCTTTTIELFVNAVGSGGSTALGGTQNYLASAIFTLGGSNAAGTNSNFDGALCEVITASSALSGSDVSNCETYLANKWGITL